ncbi:MAG TPA: hypothetical protein VLS85_02815, partial [Hanamia sp.]|nr:hypothetical protein [Hanamia sp.]
PVDDVFRKRAEKEHKSIYKLVKAIDKNKSDPDLLNQLANELEKHIRFEEREFFNHLQNNITPEGLESIEKHSPNNGKTIDESWEDIFWEIKK